MAIDSDRKMLGFYVAYPREAGGLLIEREASVQDSEANGVLLATKMLHQILLTRKSRHVNVAGPAENASFRCDLEML